MNKKTREIIRRLLRYLQPYSGRFIVALLAFGATAGLTGLITALIKPTIDRVFIAHQINMLYHLLWVIPLIFLLKGLFFYLSIYLMSYITQRVMWQLRDDLYCRIQLLSHDFFDHNPVGKLTARITNDVNTLQLALMRVPQAFLRDGLTIIFFVGLLFYLNWHLAIVVLVIFPLAAFPLIQFSQKMRSSSRHSQRKIADIYSLLYENLSGISIIKAFCREADELQRFSRENEKYYQAQMRFMRVDARSTPIMEFLGAMGFVFILWYSASSVIQGKWTAGSFLTFITAAFSVYSPLRNFSQTNSILQPALAGAERIFQLLDSYPTIQDAPGARALTRFSQVSPLIKFVNVTFTYPTRQTPALKNINLEIEQSKTLAIVGQSGSGKTSLVHLLLRFYDPQEGIITIGGEDIRNFTLASLRQNIAVVSQDIFLFNESVSYNIAYGCPSAGPREIRWAAEQAYADIFINRLPDGYNTIIGERGVRLSGGEKQRIALARAILKNAPIMILDEATSSLDTDSEKLIQQALDKVLVNKTVLVIAHRLSTIKKADRIVVLDAGQIVESGTHDELLNTPGVYQRLCNLQIL